MDAMRRLWMEFPMSVKIAEGFEQKATNLPCKCCKGMLEFIEKKKRKLIM